MSEPPEITGYERWHVAVSAAVAIVVSALSVWVASRFAVVAEALPRISPTAKGPNRGVGANWVAGNAEPALEALIALVHLADVVLGLFIVLMVVLHWAAFRRLAARMKGGTG